MAQRVDAMIRVLIVEDSPFQARVIDSLLASSGLGTETVIAGDGIAALEHLGRAPFDLVLTDLQMPRMDGLALVEAMRSAHPGIPAILMTAHGSEEIAVQALEKGAASYVPKDRMAERLVATVTQVYEVAKATREEHRLLDYLITSERRYVLPNDVALVPPLAAQCEEELTRRAICDGPGALQVCIALTEAIANAIYHGNLEVPSDLKESGRFAGLVAARRESSPYGERRVEFTATVTSAEATYVVRDEGPGFDPSSLPDPRDPSSLDRPSGRGILLIRAFMDEVRHSRAGNEITMIRTRRV